MSETTLPSAHRIRTSNHGGLRPRTLPLGHGGSPQFLRVGGEDFFFFQTETGTLTPNSNVKGSGANHHPGIPFFIFFSNTEYFSSPFMQCIMHSIVHTFFFSAAKYIHIIILQAFFVRVDQLLLVIFWDLKQ